jgi:ribose 5-phosphate isomerase RpiB
VLALGAQFVDAARAAEIAEVFLSARCTEERHLRRVGKIRDLEKAYLK